MLYELLEFLYNTHDESFIQLINDFKKRLNTTAASLGGLTRGFGVSYDETSKSYVHTPSENFAVGGDYGSYGSIRPYSLNNQINHLQNRINDEIIQELNDWLKSKFLGCDSTIEALLQDFQTTTRQSPKSLLVFFEHLSKNLASPLVKKINELEDEIIAIRAELSDISQQIENDQKPAIEQQIQTLVENPRFFNHQPFSERAKETASFIKDFIKSLNTYTQVSDQWEQASIQKDLLPFNNVFPDDIANQLKHIFEKPKNYRALLEKLNRKLSEQQHLRKENELNLKQVTELMAHKLGLLEQSYCEILATQKQSKESSVENVTEEPSKPFDLNQFIEHNQLTSIISTCECMSNQKRIKVGHACLTAAEKLQSKKITIVSIGSSRLKQELMTAEALMQKGYDVNFILIEPGYYLDAMGYDKINYPELKCAFDKVALALNEAYGKKCEIVDVFPSVYFYLKKLSSGFNIKLDEKFLVEETVQFKPNIGKLFYLKTDATHPNEDSRVQLWREQHPEDALIIQTKTECFVALRFDGKDKDSFFIEKSDKIKSVLNLPAIQHKFSHSLKPVEIELEFSYMPLVWNPITTAAARQVHQRLSDISKQLSIPHSMTDLLPNLILVVDSSTRTMDTTLSNVSVFLEECYKQQHLLLPSAILRFEKQDVSPKFKNLPAVLENADETFIPPVLKK